MRRVLIRGAVDGEEATKRARSAKTEPSSCIPGRGERIRTSGLYVPNVALYQAKLHPESVQTYRPIQAYTSACLDLPCGTGVAARHTRMHIA